MSTSSKILITGASGIVGNAILRKLSSQGKQIKALVFNSSKIDSKLANVEWIKHNILDIDALDEIMQDVSEVYHCLNFTSFLDSDANNIYDINVRGTENVVNACLSNKVKKIVYLSNNFGFGSYTHKKEITENTKWVESKSNSLYAVCKNRAEMEIWRAKEEGLDTIIVNPSLIIAPKQDKLYNLKHIAASDYKYKLEGENGFVALDDVVNICIQLMQSEIKGEQFILNAENLKYDTVFELLSPSKSTHKAFRRMTLTKANIIAQINQGRNILFGTRPFLSKDILALNKKSFHFSNEKIKKALNFEFTPISEYAKKIN